MEAKPKEVKVEKPKEPKKPVKKGGKGKSTRDFTFVRENKEVLITFD